MSDLVVGVDLGGTETKIGIVEENGRILSKSIIPTKVFEGRIAVVTRIVEAIKQLIMETGISVDGVVGIGVGSPGSIDHETLRAFSPIFRLVGFRIDRHS